LPILKSLIGLDLLEGDPNANHRHAAEVQLLWELRQGLREDEDGCFEGRKTQVACVEIFTICSC
jgi:hypothetical protein